MFTLKNKFTNNLKNFSYNFSTSFPYLFKNTRRRNEIDKHFYLNKSRKDAFLLCYVNFITSIYEKDENFIRNVCGKNFSEKLIENLNKKEYKDGLFLNDISEEDLKIQIDSLMFEINIGISKNIKYNIENNFRQIFSILSKPDLNIYSFKPINTFRLFLDIKSNLILSEKKISDLNIC